jgi:DNA-binding NtrC family response regulator
MNRHRIMVIDDEKIVCDMAKLSLQQEGYVVETFMKAATALKRLEEQKFDVVVTDYRMQDIDGMEVLRTVKSQYPTTQVIMMTAYANLDSALEALRRDVHDFFAKPVKIKDLKASIKRALDKDTWVFKTC